jgi:hypothetical protein
MAQSIVPVLYQAMSRQQFSIITNVTCMQIFSQSPKGLVAWAILCCYCKENKSVLIVSKVAVCCFSWGICYDFYSFARQPCPAALPGSLARQPCPAALPGSLARQPCQAALRPAVYCKLSLQIKRHWPVSCERESSSLQREVSVPSRSHHNSHDTRAIAILSLV